MEGGHVITDPRFPMSDEDDTDEPGAEIPEDNEIVIDPRFESRFITIYGEDGIVEPMNEGDGPEIPEENEIVIEPMNMNEDYRPEIPEEDNEIVIDPRFESRFLTIYGEDGIVEPDIPEENEIVIDPRFEQFMPQFSSLSESEVDDTDEPTNEDYGPEIPEENEIVIDPRFEQLESRFMTIYGEDGIVEPMNMNEDYGPEISEENQIVIDTRFRQFMSVSEEYDTDEPTNEDYGEEIPEENEIEIDPRFEQLESRFMSLYEDHEPIYGPEIPL
ncbi:unnamed protein product [Arabis nemorensis]|uniref:Uncharacterized protein n=1 Tax=Arabis nemorensis TaxID=586526 RepID=A0A565CK17_9BRAS|nr:unnamed protein product [Arabis nemorensis]